MVANISVVFPQKNIIAGCCYYDLCSNKNPIFTLHENYLLQLNKRMVIIKQLPSKLQYIDDDQKI